MAEVQFIGQPPPEKKGAEKREKFLLRLLVGKFVHPIKGRPGMPPQLPRVVLMGFDEYLMKLMGQPLYEELNSDARGLLSHIKSDDDFIWREIWKNELYGRFVLNILVRFLLKFTNFERAKNTFESILNDKIGQTDKKFVFEEKHFKLLFLTLFADVFTLCKEEKVR
ncbi:MAG: hypothetical protein EXQ90_09105 [Rhodospirillales bacterium]|nr:hypothetical protein [Rhodospirillales bacterium]